jgi:hypothetical protein
MKVWSSRGIISYDTATYQTLPQLTKNDEEPMPLTSMRQEGSSPGGHQLKEQPWLCRIGRGYLIRKRHMAMPTCGLAPR